MPNEHVIVQSKPEAEVVAELTKKGIEARVLTVHSPDGAEAEVLVLPASLTAKSIKELVDENRQAPLRRRGTAELTTLGSFIAHVNLFKNADSVIFADRTPSKPALLAVIDYNRHGPDGAARYGEHRARYDFPLSEELTVWRAMNGKGMPQEAFAGWIEDHLTDVSDPAGAQQGALAFAGLFGCAFASASRLLELSRGLSVHVGARVQNHVNLSTGETAVTFAEGHADDSGRPLKIPGAFLLGIPVFRGGAPYQIPARLRYRVASGSITWSYDLYRIDAVFDHAFDEACETAEEGTELPLFMGTPEAAG
jgi:uncharacterized protein YfdQ (DUF2303 family)